jgi:hypothetical protein
MNLKNPFFDELEDDYKYTRKPEVCCALVRFILAFACVLAGCALATRCVLKDLNRKQVQNALLGSC